MLRFPCPACGVSPRAPTHLAGQPGSCTRPAPAPVAVARLRGALPLPPWRWAADNPLRARGQPPIHGHTARLPRAVMLLTLAAGGALALLLWLPLARRAVRSLPPLVPPPEFDPADFGRTARWAYTGAREVDAHRGRDVATARALGHVEARLAGLAGRRVVWRLEVEEVRSRDGQAFVRVRPASFPYDARRRTALLEEVTAPGRYPGNPELYVTVAVGGAGGGLRVPAGGRSAGLRPGDFAAVAGTVARVEVAHNGWGLPCCAFTFVLKDCGLR